MEDLNINRDKPDITDEQILKHRNFDAVMNTVAVTKVPWYKVGKFWLLGGSAIVVLVATVMLITNYSTSNEEVVEVVSNTIKDAQESDVNQMVKEEKEENQVSIFHVTPKSMEVFTPLNLKIQVPREVIIDEDASGSSIFDVSITNLDVPENIELPPHSKKESFQLDFSYNDKTVEFYGAESTLVKDESVTIYESTIDGWKPMQTYKYDKEVVLYDSVPTMLLPEQSSRPALVFDSEYEIENKVAEFEEISGYKNFVFQPIEEIPEGWYEKNMWEDVRVEKIEDGIYKLYLLKFDQEKECLVKLAFPEGDFQKAMNQYNTSFEKQENLSIEKGRFYVLNDGGKYIVLYP